MYSLLPLSRTIQEPITARVQCTGFKQQGNADTQHIYLTEEVDLSDGVGSVAGIADQNYNQLNERIHCVVALGPRHGCIDGLSGW